MTTHRNILANCRGAYRLLEMLGLGDEVFLSFLPLSHSYEHTAGMMFPISIGAQIYFAEGAETLAANLLEARPTIMTAVPRLYETMHRRITLGVERKSAIARRMFHKTVAIGRKRAAHAAPNLTERLADPVLDRVVRANVRRAFWRQAQGDGVGRGSAEPGDRQFFPGPRCTLLQGYGQTEAAPVIACNTPTRIKIETVGPPLDGVEVRIAEDGEILVAGDNVMKGYWNDPQATAQALVEGWLHTGDIGRIDDDGYICITDRKRDFIKNSGGEMISPARVEGVFDAGAGNRPGNRVRRPPAVSRRGAGSGCRNSAAISPARTGANRCCPAWRPTRDLQGDRRCDRAGQPGVGAGRAGSPVHRRERAVHHRQRANDPDPEGASRHAIREA